MLKDKITDVDTTGMSAEKKKLYLEGIAYQCLPHNEDGTLNISDPVAIEDAWKDRQVEILEVWSEDAQKYKQKLAGTTGIISIKDA